MAFRVPTHRAPTHPGEMLLKEFLEPMEITQSELATAIGVSFVRVNSIINGKRGITPDTALRLEKYFGVSAQSWLNTQLRWDLYHAMRSPEAKTLRQIRPAKQLATARAQKN